MQYIVEFLELWGACLKAAFKDRSLAFPITFVVGALAGALFWYLAALVARLFNKRFHLKLGLQILCGGAALLAVIFALTFTSSRYMEEAVKMRLSAWKNEVLLDQDWQHEAFCDAWDAVAKAGHEADVRPEPSPRTDSTINIMSMGHPESKKAVVRTYTHAAFVRFSQDHPYLMSVLSPSPEIPEDRLDASTISWFTDHPGEPYPLERGIAVVVAILEDQARNQTKAVAQYTQRMSIALFGITQLIVFGVIGFIANRSNRPAISR